MRCSTVSQPRSKRLGWPLRWTCLCSGLLVVALLIVAGCLEPSPSGYGTHQALGLPPCTSILLFNSPCPACGMTTSWAWLIRGNLAAAAQANIGGLLLALVGLFYVPSSFYFFVSGIASRNERFSLYLSMALLIAIVAAAAQWYLRLGYSS